MPIMFMIFFDENTVIPGCVQGLLIGRVCTLFNHHVSVKDKTVKKNNPDVGVY